MSNLPPAWIQSLGGLQSLSGQSLSGQSLSGQQFAGQQFAGQQFTAPNSLSRPPKLVLREELQTEISEWLPEV